MRHHYENEFKQKIVRLHIEEGRTLLSLQKEYNVSKAAISKWIKQFRDECQANSEAKEDYNYMQESLRLRKKLEEVRKENLFLRKSSGILCEGNRLTAYRFIQKYHELFGVRWLLRRLQIYPNAYYTFLKNKKATYA